MSYVIEQHLSYEYFNTLELQKIVLLRHFFFVPDGLNHLNSQKLQKNYKYLFLFKNIKKRSTSERCSHLPFEIIKRTLCSYSKIPSSAECSRNMTFTNVPNNCG